MNENIFILYIPNSPSSTGKLLKPDSIACDNSPIRSYKCFMLMSIDVISCDNGCCSCSDLCLRLNLSLMYFTKVFELLFFG